MISIVIPTLQKRLDILEKLVNSLNNDPAVGEIIVINNAVKPLEFSYEKMRVITPEANIYVNPAWNLGVKEGVNEYVGLLNDDIIIADDFCSRMLDVIPDDFGIIGYTKESIIPVEEGEQNPEEAEIKLVKTDFIDFGFGICMFFKKENYPVIPKDMKIMYGDCWIFNEYKKKGLKNYIIKGQKIFHLGSLTSSSKALNPVITEDKKFYKKYTLPWYKKLFSIEENANNLRLRFFGMNIRLYNKR